MDLVTELRRNAWRCVGALRRNAFCPAPSKSFWWYADWILGTRFATFSGYAPMAAPRAPMAPPAKPGERKVVIVIFVVERVIRVELRHRRRMGFAISV
jgi:hypothetical protein